MFSEKKSNFNIEYNLVPECQRQTPPNIDDDIVFGKTPTPHMLVCDYIGSAGGWQTPVIQPFAPFSFRPDAMVLHYGQTIFEGLKAFRDQTGQRVLLFRPDRNAARMASSAQRMSMPPLPKDLFVHCVKELVAVDKNWVLPSPGSLYVRPSMVALEDGISYRAAENYRFFIIMSPAKAYFKNPVAISVYIERELSRAAPGGCGTAKCGGNYAGALVPMFQAKQMGAEQVLWLDAAKKLYVEEAGAMNIMFAYGDKIITPELNGSILPGITRETLIQIARETGYQVDECSVPINQILHDIEKGDVTEVFSSGTAAVVSSIGTLIDGNKKYTISDGKPGKVALTLKQKLLDIQTCKIADTHNWLVHV